MIANTGKLAGKTIFITGASRGIGKAIALKAASDGANIVVAAKTADPHPKLPGTIYSAAEEIEAAGGKALPCVVDVRDENQVRSAVENAVKKFGGIDILVNNASAIQLTPTASTDMKRFDLMHQINTRGTFLVSKECLPYLQKSSHAHILNISPPLNMKPIWFGNHVAYTMAKYGMSMCVLGMAEEFKSMKIGVNALWPMTAIHTAAIEMLTGPDSDQYSRKVDIMSDAAYTILTKDPKTCTGNFFVDEKVVLEAGVTDLKPYACNPEMADQLMIDAFLDVAPGETLKMPKKTSDTKSAGGSVADVFAKLEKFITPEVIEKTSATYQFDLYGDQAGTWFLDLKNAPGKTGQGKPDFVPDATLTMDSNNFFKMFSGELKPATAFMSGKLKIRGDMAKALKMEKLLGAMKKAKL